MAEARPKGMGRGLLLQAVAAAVFFMLLAHASTALAALGRNGRAPVYLRAEVSLQYQKDLGRDSSGKDIEGESIKEHAKLTYGAYIIDPRLATYVATLTLENNDSSGRMGEKTRLMGGTFDTVFFDRVNRSRGAGFWRYVPSPMTIGVSHYDSTQSVTTKYTLGAYYMLPGYMVLFDGDSWFSYNPTGKLNRNNAGNANRYRVKYTDESINYNRNGNGNWNRNGNGNWNRNGNGNWNRNGNGNWNRNGNGNWNQNNNANANGSSEAQGQSNQEGDYNANIERKPYVFRFPSLSLNMSHSDKKFKNVDNEGYLETGDLRAQTSNVEEERLYHSDYQLHYHWYKSQWETGTDQDSRQMDIDTNNEWRRFRLQNSLLMRDDTTAGSSAERTSFDSVARWRDDSIDYFLYEIAGGVSYDKYNESEGKYTFLSGLAELHYNRSRSLSTRLREETFARAQYTASRSQGDRENNAENWRLDASETLVSHHLEHVEARAAGSVGHDEYGTPLTASVSASTQGLPRLNAFAEYAYTTVLSSNSEEEYQRNRFTATCRYYLTILLDISARFVYENYSQVSGGAVHVSTYGSYTESEAVVTWRPKAGLSLMGHTLMRTTDYEDYVENGISANKTMGRRSSMTASAVVDTKSTSPGRHEAYRAAYVFNRPKFDFSLEYHNDKWYQGWTENRIYMNIRRIFGRR